MSKYMLIFRWDGTTPREMDGTTDFDEMLGVMGRFNDELIRAGVLVAAEGLDDPANGVVVDFTGETPVVTDGPYGEVKELFNGFYIIDVSGLQEAVEWTKRMPKTRGTKVEVRRVPSIDEFPQDNEYVQREREWREANGQL